MFAAMAAMWVSCGTPETEQSGRPGDGGASVSGNGGYLFVHMTDTARETVTGQLKMPVMRQFYLKALLLKQKMCRVRGIQ